MNVLIIMKMVFILLKKFFFINFLEELDEPFSDSDEEKIKFQKPNLIIPRGRIRTLSGTVPPNGYSPKWGGPTMCLCCFQFFDLPDSIGKFAKYFICKKLCFYFFLVIYLKIIKLLLKMLILL